MTTSQLQSEEVSSKSITTGMAKTVRLLLPLLLLFILVLPVTSEAQDFTYTTIDGTITITGYTGPGGNVTIPSTINGLPVTSIGSEAFARLLSLTSVTIPDSVTYIGDSAFHECSSLTQVTIPDSVTNIAHNAFGFCDSLASLTIGKSVSSIGGAAFAGCIRLTNVTIPDSVTRIEDGPTITSMGGPVGAFFRCTRLTNAIVGKGLTYLGVGTFDFCTNLVGVYFQGNAPTPGVDPILGVDVFRNDDSAIVYYLPGTTGWSTTFAGRPTMLLNQVFTYTTIDGTITITGYTGPGGYVTIPSTIDGLPVTRIGESAFDSLTTLTGVVFPDTVTSIGDMAFSGCTNLTSVAIPDSVTHLGDGAFSFCTRLASLTIGKGITTIRGGASSVWKWGTFQSCVSLTQVTIPDNVTNISDGELHLGGALGAFYDCSGLTNVTVGKGLIYLGTGAFNYCTNLVGVYFQGNAPTPGINTFGEDIFHFDDLATVYYLPGKTGWGTTFAGRPTMLLNQGFTYTTINGTITITGYTGPSGDVTIPSTINGLPVTTIGVEAFLYRDSLTSVTIPNSVTYIGNAAFCGCGSLTSVTIPDSVTNIADNAFARCNNVASLTIGTNVSSIGGAAFARCTSLTNVTIPDSVTRIEDGPGGSADGAFSNCTRLTNVFVGKGLTYLGVGAFDSCTNLHGVYFQGNAPTPGVDAVLGVDVFSGDDSAIVYYLPGTTGWGATFAGRPTMLWEQVFTYTTIDGTITITGYTGPGGNVAIPASINGIPVTRIGSEAFSRLLSLTNIMIPNGVTYIGDAAFYECSGLTRLTIPNGVTNIANNAFAFCTNLASLTIGQSVISIGGAAFAGCTSLTNVTIPDNVIRIEDGPASKGGPVGAFFDCTSLTNVIVGKGLTYLGVGAFDFCTNLVGVYFQGNAPTPGVDPILGVDVFRYADSAIVYYLPGTTGWSNTFAGRPTVLLNQDFIYTTINGTITITGYTGPGGNVTIPSTINGLPVTSIGTGEWTGVFGSSSSSLTGLTIPDSVTNIAQSAFSACVNLASLTIGKSVISIGGMAFAWCSSLTSVTIPDSVTRIEDGVGSKGGPLGAFWDCTSLTNVIVGKGLTYLGTGAFDYCTNLLSVYFQGNAPTPGFAFLLGVDVFRYDDWAIVYYLPGTTGWSNTFAGRPTVLLNQDFTYTTINDTITITGYTGPGGDVTLPDKINGLPVTSIGANAFLESDSLMYVRLPNSIASIGEGAFQGCVNLIYISIGAGITNIGDRAFYSCTNLQNVSFVSNMMDAGFPGNPPTLGSDVFYGITHASVYVLNPLPSWGPTFGGLPTVLSFWPTRQSSLAVRSNGFGFTINGNSGSAIVVEACTNIVSPTWSAVATNTITTSGTSYFSEPQYTNYPSRFYRLRLP